MAKLNAETITKADIEDYINGSSDFAFELRILKKINDLGFDCSHSGVYEDPVTKKSREFDIRAEKSHFNKSFRLAVECKNIRNNFPLVAHCVKRTSTESYHDIVVTNPEIRSGSYVVNFGVRHSSQRVSLTGNKSLYPEGGLVAKSIDQVGKGSNGIISNDGSVFEKINQALHSAYDLIRAAHYDKAETTRNASIVLPILVIPDSRLWVIEYDEHGEQIGELNLADRVSYYVGQSWRVGYVGEKHMDFIWYEMSHLEIVSASHLETLLNELCCSQEALERTFTDEDLDNLIAAYGDE